MDLDSDSELSDSDIELQEAFAEGKLKPGLNIAQATKKKKYNNNLDGLKHKLEEITLNLPWIERVDCTNDQAPLAPELAAQLLTYEQKRENQLKNNKKLSQFKPTEDPVLNDFKREMVFYRQAQAAILQAIPKLKSLNLSTKRPEDYFAEMAKTDEHMQKIRKHLMEKQQQQQRSERVKELRQQRKDGKLLQIQTKLQREKEKKELLDKVKKFRNGKSKDLDFLEPKKNSSSKAISRKALEKRNLKNKKFGFGGKKKGSKMNTKESAISFSSSRDNNKKKSFSSSKNTKNFKGNRPGKNRRIKSRNKK